MIKYLYYHYITLTLLINYVIALRDLSNSELIGKDVINICEPADSDNLGIRNANAAQEGLFMDGGLRKGSVVHKSIARNYREPRIVFLLGLQKPIVNHVTG